MRTGTATLLIAGLALGFGSGWWARSLKDQDQAQRASRETELADDAAREELLRLREQVRVLEARAPVESGSEASGASGAGAAGASESAATDGKGSGSKFTEADFAVMMKAWRPMFEQQVTSWAKGRSGGISSAMALKPEDAELLATALGKDASRQLDAAWEMLFGDADIDPDALSIFQGIMSGEISEDLERELTSFLSDDQVHSFRDEFGKAHEKQKDQLIDMSIQMMGVPGLSDDQRNKLRDVFRDTDPMREWNMNFARMMREPETLRDVIDDPEKFADEMKKGAQGQRDHLRNILNEEQMKQADRSYEMMIEFMRAQMQPFVPKKK